MAYGNTGKNGKSAEWSWGWWKRRKAKGSFKGGGTGNKESFDSIQEVDSTNAKEIFQATTTSGVADTKGKLAAPRTLEIQNVGESALGITIQVPIWTDDTTQSGSNYIQMILPRGANFSLPTTQIVQG